MILNNAKTYYIGLDEGKYKVRKVHMDNLLNKAHFKYTHFKTQGLGEQPDLKKAVISILEENLNDEPVLILEDDVEFFGQNLNIVEKDKLVRL